MNTMKKILYIVLGVLVMSVTSCMEVDNWAEPDTRVHGRIIDSYTGENLLTAQGDWGIRIWERTWKDSEPTAQSLSVMQDGSYNNNKLFGGTYDMLPYGGPFWPVDTLRDVVFGGTTEQDFTVTPYLQVLGLETELKGLKLTLTCVVKAPIRQGLPNLVEVKPFLSLNQFCGATNGSFIDLNEYNEKRIQYNKPWVEAFGDVEQSEVIRIGPLPVKPGYTYYVRVGANVNDANKKYNYSEIVKVVVPADAKNDPNEFPDNFFKNASYPFTKGDWDGVRWGDLADWKTNDAMKTRNGRGGFDNGWEAPDKPSLGFERWGAGETPIINGTLYQTWDLPAGTYRFTMSFAGDNPIKSNSGDNPRFIAVAEGDGLPATENIASAIKSASFVGLSQETGVVAVDFTLGAPKKISAGFVAKFEGLEQNVRISFVKLEKLN
jgi:hypothetical protein